MTRQLDSGKVDLIRQWFEQGIDSGLIGEVIAARAAQQTIGTLKYFHKAIPEAWARRREGMRELLACAQIPDPPPLDLNQQLEDLIASIPDDLPRRGGLIQEMVELRGRAQAETEFVEDRLQHIECVFLAQIPLTVEQKQQLEGSMATLAQRLPRSEFTKHRRRLVRQLKREGLRLPVLSLFQEQTF